MTDQPGPERHDAPRLTTRQAAELLGVKPETVYAYVSRGQLSSVRAAGGGAARSTPRRSGRW
ncbi:citrate synthase, partial [Streptomyces sp. Ncost-T6T-2b]